MPEAEGSRKRNSEAVVEPPKFKTIGAADAPIFKVVVAPKGINGGSCGIKQSKGGGRIG